MLMHQTKFANLAKYFFNVYYLKFLIYFLNLFMIFFIDKIIFFVFSNCYRHLELHFFES